MSLITSHHIATEDDVIQNSKLEHLYNHNFGSGRFFQVVFEDEKEVDIKLASRTLLKIVYLTKVSHFVLSYHFTMVCELTMIFNKTKLVTATN